MNDVAVHLCAEGESNLQAALHAGLGQRWNVTETVGWAPTGAPHPLLFSAVTLTEDLPCQALLAGPGTICDSFAALAPDVLPGRRHEPGPPWMLRDPEPLHPARLVEGLQIRQVTEDHEVDIWEELVFSANAAQRTHPGELHPAGSQRYPGLALLLAGPDEKPVGAALGLVGSSCVTVSAVAVLPSHRRSGIGAALTAAVIALAPDKPATLSTSALGKGVYESLGFRTVGIPLHWC